MVSRHNVGTKPRNQVTVPMVRSSTYHQGRKQDKPLTVVHVDRLEAYRGAAVPAWMTAEQRGCVAV